MTSPTQAAAGKLGWRLGRRGDAQRRPAVLSPATARPGVSARRARARR